MKEHKYLYFSIISLVLFLVAALVSGYWGGHSIKFLVNSIGYTIAVNFFLNNSKAVIEKLIGILILLFPLLATDLPIHIIDFKETLISLPSSLGAYWGLFFGLIIFQSNKWLKLFFATISLIVTLWVSFCGYALWINYLNYNTFNGKTKEAVPVFSLINSNNIILNNDSIYNYVTVFDFWNTSCGYCFQTFPLLETKRNSYSKNNSVKFYSVNIVMKEDTIGEAINVISKLGYKFPVLRGDTTISNKFNINGYPTVLILYKNKIYYRGTLDNIDATIKTLMP